MNVGTIGTSFITDYLIEAMKKVDGVTVYGCYSRTKDKAEEFRDKHQLNQSYYNLIDMFNDSNIDTIYIASPNSLHFTHAYKALEHNKNVIVEKPFASNLSEAKKLKDLAISKKLFLFEAITTMHNPSYLSLRSNVDNIRPLKIIQCNMSQYSRKYDDHLAGLCPNVFTTKYSGGALMDINIYNIHFTVGILGRPKKVVYNANMINGIDTSGVLNLIYDDVVATLVGSKDNIGVNLCQIQGENGYIHCNYAASVIDEYSISMRKNKSFNIVDNHDTNNVYYHLIQSIYNIYNNNDYDSCYKLLDHSLRVMEVVDAAKKSASIVFEND